MARTAGVRFRSAGKIFYYEAGELELQTSQYVVVETSHGLAVGRVVIAPDQVISNESSNQAEMKPILRLATDEDIAMMEASQEKAKDALHLAKQKASDQGLLMSIASGEFDLEGRQFTAYFTAEERIDFRNLVRDLSRDLGVHVQLLQVGDRDRAKLVDGMDVCGQRLCCASWMTNFPSVSIRMAKEQELPLNPQKISGVCGRLYCCLTFEYEDYKALRGTLPKVGSVVSTPAGAARVTAIDFNREVVKLYLIDSNTAIEIDAIDFKLQNGVTIRPMDLVRKVEGQYRSISEDRPVERPQEQRQRSDRPRGPRQPRPPRDIVAEAEEIAAAAQAAAEAPSTEETAEGGQKRRRRRRRRGRGGGGESPPAGSD
jgi:cell fate regulator YaaT (PSP1 superfamily)